MYRRLANWVAKRSTAPKELRRAPRVPDPCVVAYHWDGSAPVGRRLRDISMTGAYLYTTERWYPGTIVRLLLQEPVASGPGSASPPGASVSIPSRVVWHGSERHGFGISVSQSAGSRTVAATDRCGFKQLSGNR